MEPASAPARGPDRAGLSPRSPQDAAAGLFLIALALIAFLATQDLSSGTLRNIGPGLMPRATAVLVAALGVAILIGSFAAAGPALERWSWGSIGYVLGGVVAFAATIRATPLDAGILRGMALVAAGGLAYRFAPRVMPVSLRDAEGDAPRLAPALARLALAGTVAALAGWLAQAAIPSTAALPVPIGGLAVAGPLVVLISAGADEDLRWGEILIFGLVMTALCIGLFRYLLNLPIPVLIVPGLLYV